MNASLLYEGGQTSHSRKTSGSFSVCVDTHSENGFAVLSGGPHPTSLVPEGLWSVQFTEMRHHLTLCQVGGSS